MARRICFISSRAGYFANDQSVLMDGPNGRLVVQLVNHFGTDKVSIALFDDPEKKDIYDQPIGVKKAYRLPFPFSQAGGMRNVMRITRIMKEIQKNNDVLVVQLPIIGFPSLLALRKPTLFHVCANVLTAAINPLKYRGLKGMFAKQVARTITSFNKKLFRRGNTKLIVNGSELGELYKSSNPTVVVSSSIFESDIVHRLPVNGSIPPLAVIFIGRPSLEKGFDVLIDALEGLSIDFRLNVVGFDEGEFQRMLPQAYDRSKHFLSQITFHGYVNWGPALKNILKHQHILVIPSRSEGTPRVILESLSQGVPVIGSNIGGIPDILHYESNGMLFQFDSADDLRNKLTLLAGDEFLRKKLATSGLDFTRNHTVEKFASHFINHIQSLCNE